MNTESRFEKIYNEYYSKTLQYVTRIVGPNEAEDITQDVFSKIYSGLAEFQGRSKLSTWIYRIATNTAIDRTRSASHKHAKESIAVKEDAELVSNGATEDTPAHSTDQLLIHKEMRDCLNEYIDTLPPDYKTVIVLSEMEGFKNREIAEILDISIDNVKIRLHRARAQLKAVLKDVCDFYYSDQNTLRCDRKQTQILPTPRK